MKNKHSINNTAASLQGHSFHHAWAARSALGLLLPKTSLKVISIEGFTKEDDSVIGQAAAEIADLVKYYDGSNIEQANRTEVVQFKYSIARADNEIRAADIAKTIKKFAENDKDLSAQYGQSFVEERIFYEFITNRPVHCNLLDAINNLKTQQSSRGDIAKQSKKIQAALQDSAIDIPSFLRRLEIIGSAGTLQDAKNGIHRMLASWGESTDPETRKRFLELLNLVRTKAESTDVQQRSVQCVNILGIWNIEEKDLYPTPDAFPDVKNCIERSILNNIVARSQNETLPLIVHGKGGTGKTVLMQTLAKRLSVSNEVVLFDGFGGGQWRNPADGRHLSQRTLIHLANILAGKGRCDILLPINDTVSLLQKFRDRLMQAVKTLRQHYTNANVVLLLDSIDHAAISAENEQEKSFAWALLSTLALEPIDGVKIIASCRTERRQLAVKEAQCAYFEVPVFTADEARQLILKTDSKAQEVDIANLVSRSGCNPRCIAMLIEDGRPYASVIAGQQGNGQAVALDTLIQKRLERAKSDALSKGAKEADIETMLAGLAILPLPVPIEELAAANGMTKEQAESFATDLFPLLVHTNHGLFFRDEPTETFIRESYGNNQQSQQQIVEQLLHRQCQSYYAARALPPVLQMLARTDELFALAFDEKQMPANVNKLIYREIRLARLMAALKACATTARFDDVMRLLLEASLVATGHSRADQFLYDYPDLAAKVGDRETLRRLFSTKKGWAGGRQAVLAMAHAFTGNDVEAKMHASEAITWYNWKASQPESKTYEQNHIPDENEVIRFSYVEVLTGNTYPIQWLAKQKENDAYAKLSAVFAFLERHAAIDPTKVGIAKALLIKKMVKCKLPQSSFWTAVLEFTTHSDNDARALIRKLAKSKAPAKPDVTFQKALLRAVALALQLGMQRETKKIIGWVVHRPSVYDFSSHWGLEQGVIECAVIKAGLTAALRGTPPCLHDIAPREFLELIPQNKGRPSAEVFEEAFKTLLRDESMGKANQSKGKKPKLGSEKRDEYSRVLEQRLKPLLAVASIIANIASVNKKSDIPANILEALHLLEVNIQNATDYPYRDQKSYLAHTCFTAIFTIADTLDGFDKTSADALVAWLEHASGIFIPQLINVVARFSYSPTLHDAALRLASHIDALIKKDTDVSAKIAAYGKLAQAVLCITVDESGEYFKTALELAEAIGSEDYNRTDQLLSIISQYKGQKLSQERVHTLAQIFELNMYESEKFAWVPYAEAMSAVAGLPALARISRMDDRNKADLSLSLPALLTMLMETGDMPADLAVCLIGLEEPAESWLWQLDAFAKAALQHLPASQKEWLFEIVLLEIDRKAQLSLSHDRIRKLLDLAQQHLANHSPSRLRLEAILRRLKPYSPPAYETSPIDIAPFKDIPLHDPDAIDRALEQEPEEYTGRRHSFQSLKALAQHADNPQQRRDFIESLTKIENAELLDKLLILQDYLPEWTKNLNALRNKMPIIAEALAAKHAAELVGSAWESSSAWRILIHDLKGNPQKLVAKVLETLNTHGEGINDDACLILATQLASTVKADAFQAGLERFLDCTESTLTKEIGDGTWNKGLLVSSDATDVVAGLLWARLGNYKAASRWRAAHAVRRLAKAGRFDVIAKIIQRFDNIDAHPFVDANLPFYQMHAQLWLLLALARIAKDHPQEILPYRPLLEKMAFNPDFPHIAMRAASANALKELLPKLDKTEAALLAQKLAQVNVSSFPQVEGTRGGTAFFASRPAHAPRPENTFNLDYDFQKQEVSNLADAFGLKDWEIQDSITEKVRRWNAEIKGMYECPRVNINNLRAGSWTSGSPPDADRYGGYLGWHALMLTAGEFLLKYPTHKGYGDDDHWADFLQSQSLTLPDGFWLADATDLAPTDLITSLDMPEFDGTLPDAADVKALAPFVGIHNINTLPNKLIVGGDWSLSDNTSISINSVLVDPSEVSILIKNRLNDKKFFIWLPHDALDIEREAEEIFGSKKHGMRPWIQSNDHSWQKFDRHDPYAAPTVLNRCSPKNWVLEQANLVKDDDLKSCWSVDNKVAFFAECWGVKDSEHANNKKGSGQRMTVDTSFLKAFLQSQQKTLVGLIKARRYLPDKGRLSQGDTHPFSHRVAFFSVAADGEMRFY